MDSLIGVAQRLLMLAVVLALTGCNCGGGVPNDAGAMDAGGMDAGRADAGGTDAGGMDAGMDAGGTDAGGTDAGRTLVETLDDGTVTLPHAFPCGPGLGVAADGTAFLAHSSPSAAGVRVARLSNSTWVPLGGLINPVDQIPNINICPALVVTAAGVPYVAFATESATTRQVRVMRFVNAAWETSFLLERPISDFAPTLALDLTLDGDVPVLALAEFLASDHFATVYRLGPAGLFVRTGPAGGSTRSIRVGTGAGVLMVLRTYQNGELGPSILSDAGWSDLPLLEGPVSGTLNVGADVRGDSTRIVTSWHVQGGGRAGVRTAVRREDGGVGEVSLAQPGAYPSTVLRGVAGLTQVFTDQNNPNVVNVRDFDGGTWSTPVAVPFGAQRARLGLFNGQLYLATTNGVSARLVRLNFP